MAASAVWSTVSKKVLERGGHALILKAVCTASAGGALAAADTTNVSLAVGGYIDDVTTVLGTATTADVSITATEVDKEGATIFAKVGLGAGTSITTSGTPKDALRYVANAALSVVGANVTANGTFTVYVTVVK